MDLLTVVLHEVGLALGFVEDDAAQPEIMARTLAPGVRVTLRPFTGTAARLAALHRRLRLAQLPKASPKAKARARAAVTAKAPRGRTAAARAAQQRSQ